MSRDIAQKVLFLFVNGQNVKKELLKEAIQVELLPELNKNVDFDNIPCRTTFDIATHEPDQYKQWIEVNKLKEVLA